MSTNNFILFNYHRLNNLTDTINTVVPDYICNLPTLIFSSKQPPVSIILANLKAIANTWKLARVIGMAHLTYNKTTNIIQINPFKGGSDINNGFKVSNETDKDSSELIYTFYGIKDNYLDIGYPIISSNLSKLICNYLSVIEDAAKRIAMSYGEMWVLGGVDTNDAPLLESIQDRMIDDINKGRKAISPEGSDYKSISTSLSDLNNILTPFERAISTESTVPDWLLFPYTANSSFDLERRTVWAQQLFYKEVLPCLLLLLEIQGYRIDSVESPSFRDSFYNSQVLANLADVEYKNSATEMNKISGLSLAKEIMTSEKDVATGTSKTARDKEVKPRRGRKL